MIDEIKYEMSNFIDWLMEKPSNRERSTIILKSLTIIFAILVIMPIILAILNVQVTGKVVATQSDSKDSIPIMSLDFIILMALVAIIEELLFRVVPLSLAALVVYSTVFLLNRFYQKHIDASRIVIKAALIATIPASVIFGYAHGGLPNILVQGLGGIIFSIVYIKCGGTGKGILTGWKSSSILHFLVDVIIFLIAYIIGGMRFLTPVIS